MFFKKLIRQAFSRLSFGLFILTILNACSEGDPTNLYESLIVEFNNVQSMALESDNSVITTGDSLQLTVIGNKSQPDEVDLTEYVSWSVSDDALAKVKSGGLMETFSTDGVVTITASLSSFSATLPITLSSAALNSIDVKADTATPDTLETSVCRPLALKALGNYDDTTTRDITDKVSWSTSTASAILKTGSVISLSNFEVSTPGIAATLGAISSDDMTPVTVNVIDDIDSLVLSPLTPTLNVGETQSFQVLADFGGDTGIDISSTVSWASSDPVKADFNSNNEVLTAALSGTTTVTAVCGDQTDNTLVTVEGKALDSLTIEPDNAVRLVRINLGETAQLSVTAKYSDLTEEDVTDSAEWSVVNPVGIFISVDNVSPNKGLVSADAIGDDRVKVTFGGQEATLNVTVQ